MTRSAEEARPSVRAGADPPRTGEALTDGPGAERYVARALALAELSRLVFDPD